MSTNGKWTPRAWLIATAMMSALAWVVFPVASPKMAVSSTLLYWSLLTMGMAGQLGLLLWLVHHETGHLTWPAFRQHFHLDCPRDARSGQQRPGLFWWLILWIIPGIAGSLLAVFLGVAGGMVFAFLAGVHATVYYPLDLAAPEFADIRGAALSLLAGWVVLSLAVEELFFRGLLLPSLRPKCGQWSWVANAALYAGYYLFQPWLIPARFIQALIFTWPVQRWRSAWLSIVLRGLPNLVFLLIVAGAWRWPALEELPATLNLPRISRRPAPETNWSLFQQRRSLAALPHYDPNSNDFFQVDVRSCTHLAHSEFDSLTRWPPRDRMPVDFDPGHIMELGKNPGLGVRALQAKGITGRGIGIGIIDHYLLIEHSEYAGRVRWYEEIGQPGSAQMHAPAVASLALGGTVGVAPEAGLYHIGMADDVRVISLMYHCYARGIRRLLDLNQHLPGPEKIRVISLSIGLMPGLPGYAEFRRAIESALGQGVAVFLVKDRSSIRTDGIPRIDGLDRPCLADADSAGSYAPLRWSAGSLPRLTGSNKMDCVFVPMCSRTTASPTGAEDYTFDGQGGYSWTIPYVAGLYALAAQVNPAITPEQFRAALLRTARPMPWRGKDGTVLALPVVDPEGLMQAVAVPRAAPQAGH
jgi:membrane protease YdiL (CAAX protease family)